MVGFVFLKHKSVYLLCYAGIGALAGAKLLEILTHMGQWIYYVFSGFVFYGGLLGAIIGSVFYCREFHKDFYRHTNCLVPMIPLFHAFARIGCFFQWLLLWRGK